MIAVSSRITFSLPTTEHNCCIYDGQKVTVRARSTGSNDFRAENTVRVFNIKTVLADARAGTRVHFDRLSHRIFTFPGRKIFSAVFFPLRIDFRNRFRRRPECRTRRTAIFFFRTRETRSSTLALRFALVHRTLLCIRTTQYNIAIIIIIMRKDTERRDLVTLTGRTSWENRVLAHTTITYRYYTYAM